MRFNVNESPIKISDLQYLKSLEADASGGHLLSVVDFISRIKHSRVTLEHKNHIDTMAEHVKTWLSNGDWVPAVRRELRELIINNVSDAKSYNNLWRFGTELRNFTYRFPLSDPSAFEMHMYETYQDMLLVSSRDIKSSRQSDLYLEWQSIMSPVFLANAIKSHPAAFNFLANRFVAANVASYFSQKRYGPVYKHVNSYKAELMSYWIETHRLLKESDATRNSRAYYNYFDNPDYNNYSYDTRVDGINNLRAFWFKLALRERLTFNDIKSQPEEIANLIIQSAAYLYIQKSHPMIGNFLKTVIPMLREYIDSEFLTIDKLKDLNISILTTKIEPIELPDQLFDM